MLKRAYCKRYLPNLRHKIVLRAQDKGLVLSNMFAYEIASSAAANSPKRMKLRPR
jgi:hypothetical protein